MINAFTVYITVRSVEQLPKPDDDAVLVKATQRGLREPYTHLHGGDTSLFFVCAAGHAPTPGDELKVTIEQRDIESLKLTTVRGIHAASSGEVEEIR